MKKVLVVQGPNLNLLGKRETSIYGKATLEEIHRSLVEKGRALGLEVTTFQSNSEGQIVEAIQGAAGAGMQAIIINPAAYTHSSIAIRDALAASGKPFYEVHISNIHGREPFRAHSTISDCAAGIVIGFGVVGYELALIGVAAHLEKGGEAAESSRR